TISIRRLRSTSAPATTGRKRRADPGGFAARGGRYAFAVGSHGNGHRVQGAPRRGAARCRRDRPAPPPPRRRDARPAAGVARGVALERALVPPSALGPGG